MAKCKGCGAEIIWAITKANEKPIPLDPPVKMMVEVGRKAVGPHYGEMIVSMEDVYMPHHATCPKGAQFRRQS